MRPRTKAPSALGGVRLLYAMDVAEGFRLASPWMEEADVEHAEMVAICVGQALADQGRPGAWDTLEVADLLGCVPGPHSEQVRFARTLIDILSWMASARLLEPDTVAGYLDQIEEYGPRDAQVRSALTDARRRVGR